MTEGARRAVPAWVSAIARAASLIVAGAMGAMLAMILAATSPATSLAQAEAPLKISAEKMVGTRGPEGDIVLLTGNVRIVRESTIITSQTGTYERAVGMLYLRGGVKLVDSTTTITCDDASYSEKEDIVHLSGHVHVVDRNATLDAPAATYDRRAGRADLFGGVTGKHEDQRIESDRAAYYRDKLLIEARGNVRGYDETNKVTLRAREVDYDRGTHQSEARGEPSLESTQDGHTVIRARLLKLNTETNLAEAIDSVRVKRDTLEAVGDYGRFDDKAQLGWLVGHPRAWNDETTVTGDTIQFQTEKRELVQVNVLGHSQMQYQGLGRGSETSTLTGDRINVFVKGDDIDSLMALGNARNEYQAAAAAGKTPESNLAQGDTITVFFDDKKIDVARVQGQARGQYQLAVAKGDTAAAREEVVRYDAKMIEYHVPKHTIILEGASHLTYRDAELKARRVEFDSQRQTLVAEGNPELNDNGEKVIGNLMTYDLETRVGNIYKAETGYEAGLYHGKRIRKVSDNELQVMDGDYTTCDLPQPHYHFSSKYMKIYMKDKLVAKPVVFWIEHVPLFALPFGIFPVKPGRHSGFLFPQFELGFNNAAGRFLRNAGYYWAPNDFFDLTLSGDYYSAEPSWVLRAEGFYKVLYKFDGDFRASFAQNEALKTQDWDLDANHSQDLSPRTRLTARASYVSSRDYNSSNLYGRPLSIRLNRFLTSNLAITHSADWASFNAVVDRREDLDADQSITDPDGPGPLRGPPPGSPASLPNLTESLPALSVALPTRAIGTFGPMKGSRLGKALESMYLSMSAQFLSFYQRTGFVSGLVFPTDSTADTTTTIGQHVETRNGFAGNGSLSDSRRLFGWINFSPNVSGNMAIFDHDVLGNDIVPTGTWSASANSNTSLYGTFLRKIGPITGIRHILTPRLGYTFSPEFPNLFFIDSSGRQQPRFENFGPIAVSGVKRSALDFGLDQRLQMRLGSGDKVKRLDNLASLSLSGSYNFLYKEQNQLHPLSPLSAAILFQPPALANASGFATIDPYLGHAVRAFNYNVGVDFAGSQKKRPAAPEIPGERRNIYYTDILEEPPTGWTLGVTYSYAGGRTGPEWLSNQTANMVLRMSPTPKWGLLYSSSYDVTHRVFGVQQFSLTRDLHCWMAQFTRTFAPQGETEYYFRLAVKQQRELYVERGNRVGSIGGIH